MHQLKFLNNGGEMGTLIREKDWSQTSIDNPDTWPQSLKTTLSIVLNSKYPHFIFWGKDLICFYNDAYRPSLGNEGKHLSILGEKAVDVWTESWDIIEPLINGVFTTGQSTWHENQLIPIFRNNKIENVYWTFSYSPIFDESDSIAGVLTTLVETTNEVNARKELEIANQQYHENIMQAPIAMCIFKGDNYVVEIANKLTLDLWGKEATQVLNKPIFEGLPEAKGQGLEDIMSQVYHTGVKFEANERAVFLPKNGELQKHYLNFVYQPIKDINGNVTSIFAMGIDVTPQVVAKHKIIESEDKLKIVIDASQLGVWEFDSKQKTGIYSDRYAQIFGYQNKEQLSINKIKELLHPDDAEIRDNADKKVIETGNLNYESRVFWQDGSIHWVEVNGTLFYDEDNKPLKMIGTIRDITDDKKHEKELIERGEKLNVIIEASKLGIWEYDILGTKGTFNDRYAEIFGFEKKEHINLEKSNKLLHPDDQITRDNARDKVLESGHLNYETQFFWEDGSLHWMEVNGKLYYDEKNEPLKMIGTIRDITDEKMFEKDLLEREEKFRLLADEMPQFVWTADNQGSLNYFNKSVYNYTGLNEDTIVGDGWINIIHPEDRDQNFLAWKEAATNGNDFIFENRFINKNGESRWQLSRAKPLKDNDGNIKMWIGTSTDIHDMKEADQQKDFFISMASHELKTPITSIKGYVQLLSNKYRDSQDPFLKNALNVLNKQVTTLSTLVTDLLDVSKIKSGSLLLKKSKFALHDLVEEVIQEIQLINPKHQIIFCKEAEGVVFADKENISQVLINFLTNAVKYSPDSLNVRVKSVLDNGKIKITVSDRGIGLKEADKVKVFERFYRVEGKNEKTFPGFGIGLFIAAEIINKHEGEIGVESKFGEGSTFFFKLPIEN
jgi:PAS domain S-box-containing protein